jgi:hypothetical protein
MTESTPFELLTQVTTSYVVSRSVHAVADLGVADALGDAPQTAEALARAVGANPGALARVLRLLSAHGVFESHDGRFSHSPASRLLRSDHPQSARSYVRMLGFPAMWTSFGEMEHSIRTGLSAGEKAVPGGFWGFLTSNPEARRIFDEAMTAKAHGQVAGVTGAYDFSRFGTIGDIGGGRGHLLRAVLDKAPKARGVLFDQPQVVQRVSDISSERLKLQPGDFFKDALPVCDLYMMMEVIHDWNDEESTKILKAVRRAAPAHAKLLLIESIVPDDPGPNWAKTLDILMLTILMGCQRTQPEYAELFRSAGFRFEREIPTTANVSILEATAI